MKMYKYRMFYLTPDGDQKRKPEILEFESVNFDDAYSYSLIIMDEKPEGTRILMLAQLDR